MRPARMRDPVWAAPWADPWRKAVIPTGRSDAVDNVIPIESKKPVAEVDGVTVRAGNYATEVEISPWLWRELVEEFEACRKENRAGWTFAYCHVTKAGVWIATRQGALVDMVSAQPMTQEQADEIRADPREVGPSRKWLEPVGR